MAEPSTAVAVAEPQQRPRPPLVAGNSPRAIVPTDFDGAWRIGNAVCEAGMAPRGLDTPAKCTIAILHGLEVGLPPMQALQSISVINGRPSLWGDGALGLIQASNQLEDQDEHYEGQGDTLKAVCVLKRKGKARPYVGEFSVAQSKTAGLWTKRGRNGEPTPWQTYPERMLKMRARAFAMRDGFSDILKGLGVAEEQEDVVRAAAPEPQQHQQQEDGPPAPANDDAPPVPAEEATSGEAVEEGVFTEEGPPEPTEPETVGLSDAPTGQHKTVEVVDDFPGDKPTSSYEDGIPEFLRREPDKPAISKDEQEWLDQLEAEFGQCSTMEELSETSRGVLLPWEGSVPTSTWTLACDIQDKHVERIQGSK